MKARRNFVGLSATVPVCALLVFALCAISTSAQVWVKKPWQSWSKDDCKKVQEDSPWAQKWVQTHHEEAVATAGQQTPGTGRETEQQISYVIQIRSAMPIRQAFVRQLQLSNNYDKKSADEKKAFDAQMEGFLNRKFDDIIVVHVLYGSNVTTYAQELARIWQGYPSGTVPLQADLITSKGVHVQPIKYIPAPGGAREFELIYPRVVNGEPIITKDVKSFGIEFPHPNVSPEGAARVYGEFKIEKMTVNGEILY